VDASLRGWMNSLRAEGFVVHDFEMDDLATVRHRLVVEIAIELTGLDPVIYGPPPNAELPRDLRLAQALLQIVT